MPLIQISDLRLNVRIEGDGASLLFVHGFPLDHSMWDGQIDALAHDYRVIAPDLRGFGGSDARPGTVSMARHADDLAELLDVLQVPEPVCLCGLSMGGYVAFEFARRHRPRLQALVLCDTRAATDAPEARAKRYETADRVLAEGPGFLAETMPDRLFDRQTFDRLPAVIESTRAVIRGTSRDGIAASSRGMAERADATAWLPVIDCPTLVVAGESDAISPPAEMREFAGKIPSARFVQLADAGHMAPLEQPAAFNLELARFLQSFGIG